MLSRNVSQKTKLTKDSILFGGRCYGLIFLFQDLLTFNIVWKFKVNLVKIQVHVYCVWWINLHKLFQFNLLCAVHSYSNKPNLTTIFSSFLYFMNIDWNSVLKVLGNRLKQGKKIRILPTYQTCHLTYHLKISSKSRTVKLRVQHVLFRSTFRLFQIAYEADFGSLCTVTFWQKVDS